MERAFWWDNRQNKRLSIYSFHQNESIGPSIVSFLSLCDSRSVGCAHSGGLCTVNGSERKRKRGVKLTSSFENSTVHGRFHICAACGSRVKYSTNLFYPRTQEGTEGDLITVYSAKAKWDISMISAHLLVKMTQKPFPPPLFFLLQHQQKDEENHRRERQPQNLERNSA